MSFSVHYRIQKKTLTRAKTERYFGNEITWLQENELIFCIFFAASTYNVRMSGERPIIAAKENASPQGNSFFKCPKNRHWWSDKRVFTAVFLKQSTLLKRILHTLLLHGLLKQTNFPSKKRNQELKGWTLRWTVFMMGMLSFFY